jgi:hypothetical protein
MAMMGDWVYQVTVPPEKSDDFIQLMLRLGLADEEHLIVVRAGDFL